MLVSRHRRPLKIRDFVWENKNWDLWMLNNVKSYYFSFNEMNKKDFFSLKFKGAANFSSREEEEVSLLGWSWKNLLHIWILAKKKMALCYLVFTDLSILFLIQSVLFSMVASNTTPAQRSHMTYGMLITLHPFLITWVWTASAVKAGPFCGTIYPLIWDKQNLWLAFGNH